VTVPFDQQPFYAEKIVHLPDCYQSTTARGRSPNQTPSRAEAGLPDEVSYSAASTNNYKITAPGSCVDAAVEKGARQRLWLLGDNAGAQAHLRREASARDV